MGLAARVGAAHTADGVAGAVAGSRNRTGTGRIHSELSLGLVRNTRALRGAQGHSEHAA